MNIPFTSVNLLHCQDVYNALEPDVRIAMSPYDFIRDTEIDSLEDWIDFLKDKRVADSMNEELTLFKEAQQRKLIQRATTHDKSTGAAQMITALERTKEATQEKTGTIIVYSFVPLSAKEMQAENIEVNEEDIFQVQADAITAARLEREVL